MPNVFDHIAPDKRAEAERIDAIFRKATGWSPKVWGRLIGYGAYHYRYASGREGDWFAAGFSMRAKDVSLHIMPSYSEFPEIAKRLGPHKRGKSCWYIKNLDTIDQTALQDLIKSGVQDLTTQFEVVGT